MKTIQILKKDITFDSFGKEKVDFVELETFSAQKSFTSLKQNLTIFGTYNSSKFQYLIKTNKDIEYLYNEEELYIKETLDLKETIYSIKSLQIYKATLLIYTSDKL